MSRAGLQNNTLSMVTTTTFIYALNCPITGRTRYVGKAKDPVKRLGQHLSDVRKCHRASWVQSLINRGLKPVMEIIDEVDATFWPQWEVAYIQFFRESGFDLVNSNAGGEGGIDPTPEIREKIRVSNTGKKRSEETCAKNRDARLGKKLSPEHRAKISAGGMGRKHSEESRAKMSAARTGDKNPMFGKRPSAETRAKIAAANLGRKHSGEARAKMSVACTGRHPSIETRANMSAARLGKKRGPYKKKNYA